MSSGIFSERFTTKKMAESRQWGRDMCAAETRDDKENEGEYGYGGSERGQG